MDMHHAAIITIGAGYYMTLVILIPSVTLQAIFICNVTGQLDT